MKFKNLFFSLFMGLIACGESENAGLTSFEDEQTNDLDEYVNDYSDYNLGDTVKTGPLMQIQSKDETFIDSAGWRSMILNADKVVAYNWNGNEGNPANTQHYMIREGRIDKSARLVHTLNAEEKERWAALVTNKNNYDEMIPMCFIPHIAFLYIKDSTIIGQANICFLCAAIFNEPGKTRCLTPTGTEEVKAFCDSLGLVIYDSSNQVSD